jgi:hypothetical protein
LDDFIACNPEKIESSKYDIDIMSVTGTGNIYNPLTPHHYIQRAKELYAKYNDSDELIEKLILTDCISNCKKSIDYIMDNILNFFGLLRGKEPYGTKFRMFQIMNLLPLMTLNELKNSRNKMEHEHEIPNRSDVKRYVEICEYFYAVFNRFSSNLGYQISFENDSDRFEAVYDYEKYIFQVKIPTKTIIGYKRGGLKELMGKEPNTIVDVKIIEFHRPKTSRINRFSEPEKSYVKWCGFLLRVQL